MKFDAACVMAALFLGLPGPGICSGKSGQAPGKERLFALAIGCNHSLDPDSPPLRYADDDAVQNAQLLVQLGARVVLLVRLDSESRALHPKIPDTPPTKNAVFKAMEKLNKLMSASRKKGERPVFYFFYSGHGDVENNEGFVHLEDGRLTRSDLLDLLGGSKADTNHVIIDACKSYFLVFDRGPGGTRSPRRGPLLGESRTLPGNTGVMLSTSSAADSHEWEAFGAGVFSHELRSALRGAADLNMDGAITYEEAAAFVWVANFAIPNRRFRPDFFSRPPGGKDPAKVVLVRIQGAKGTHLLANNAPPGHWYVEDARGQRLVDAHLDKGASVNLLLPAGSPLFVRLPMTGEEIELPGKGVIRLAEEKRRKVEDVRTRGAEHVAFRELFKKPFDGKALKMYRSHIPDVDLMDLQKKPADLTWVRRSLGIVALALGAAGGTLTGLAAVKHDSVGPGTSGSARSELNARIKSYNEAAVSCYALAGASLVAYLLWTFWPQGDVDIGVMSSKGTGINLSVEF
ncbi:MAG: caspase family protein [Deltaproteobacteria bacterium]|nr:caspase family protein [Deltaproteobacteria bacterium]